MNTEDTDNPHRVRVIRDVTPICVNVTADGGVTTVLFDNEAQELLVMPGSVEWVRHEG